MNDLDQRQLANRLADALATRIGLSLQESDLDAARKDLDHLFRLERRGEATKMAELFKSMHERWPDDGSTGRNDLKTRIELVERRVAEQAALEKTKAALNNAAVRPLREPRQLPEAVAARIREAAEIQNAWPWAPPFYDLWDDADTDQLLDDVTLIHRAMFADAFFETVLQAGIVAGRRCALSCYQASVVELLLAATPDGRPRSAVFLIGAFGALPLDGTSPRLHTLNAQGHLDISTEDKARQYLKLFCGLIHGEGGPFTVISSRAEIAPFLTVPDANLPALLDTLHPPEISSPDEPESKYLWLVKVTIAYSNAIFRANMGAIQGGMIEMISDEPIVQDLPIRQPSFLLGLRQIAPAT